MSRVNMDAAWLLGRPCGTREGSSRGFGIRPMRRPHLRGTINFQRLAVKASRRASEINLAQILAVYKQSNSVKLSHYVAPHFVTPNARHGQVPHAATSFIPTNRPEHRQPCFQTVASVQEAYSQLRVCPRVLGMSFAWPNHP